MIQLNLCKCMMMSVGNSRALMEGREAVGALCGEHCTFFTSAPLCGDPSSSTLLRKGVMHRYNLHGDRFRSVVRCQVKTDLAYFLFTDSPLTRGEPINAHSSFNQLLPLLGAFYVPSPSVQCILSALGGDSRPCWRSNVRAVSVRALALTSKKRAPTKTS